MYELNYYCALIIIVVANKKVWFFDFKDLAYIQYMLRMEVYKIYVTSYNSWRMQYNLMMSDISDNVVSIISCVDY